MSTIVPTMRNSTNPTAQRWAWCLVAATLSGGTTLLLHPSVPRLLRALHVSGTGTPNAIFGYAAHATAYFVMTLAVMAIATGYGRRAEISAIGILLIHGILTETAQLAIPQRTWDPLDLTANIISILAAVLVWRFLSVQHIWRGEEVTTPD